MFQASTYARAMPSIRAPFEPSIRIGAFGEQHPGQFGHLPLHGRVQRRSPGAVQIGIRATVEEKHGEIKMEIDNGFDQRRGAVGELF